MHRKGNILFDTCNFRSMYGASSLTAVARELARYKLDLIGMQEVYFIALHGPSLWNNTACIIFYIILLSPIIYLHYRCF